jgi:hypothetical protein
MWTSNHKSSLDIDNQKYKTDNEEYYYIRSTDEIINSSKSTEERKS